MKPTAICVSCPHTLFSELIEDCEVRHLRDHTDHLFEVRLDGVVDCDEASLCTLFEYFGPDRLLITFRSTKEGGRPDARPKSRQSALLAAAAAHGPRYVDVELADLLMPGAPRVDLQAMRSHGAQIVISSHATKPVLLSWMQEQRALAETFHPDVIKVVTLGESVAASFLPMIWARQPTPHETPLLTFALGMRGQMSRMVADLSQRPPPFVFARLQDREATAPGQLDWQTMQSTYAALDLTCQQPPLYGIVGSPVVHSRSPAWHQAAFAHAQDCGRYVYCEVSSTELETFLEHAKAFFVGLSVTMPHKTAVCQLAHSRSLSATKTGTANTLRITGDKEWDADNTDAPAVFLWLQAAARQAPQPVSHVVVLGSGGFAASVVEAALALSWTVSVCARNSVRGGSLAQRFKVGVLYEADLIRLTDVIVVNATPLGMPGPQAHEHCMPLPFLPPKAILLDAVYQSGPLTAWLREGKKRGHCVVGGWPLFCEQANLQRVFWGLTALRDPKEVLDA